MRTLRLSLSGSLGSEQILIVGAEWVHGREPPQSALMADVDDLLLQILKDGDPEWFGLDFAIVGALKPHFHNALLLQAAFDDEGEALQLISSLGIEGLQPKVFPEWAACLEKWRHSREGSFKRARRSQAKISCSIGFPIRAASLPPACSLDTFLIPQVLLKVSRFRSTASKASALALNDEGRDSIEAREKHRWSALWLEFFQNAGLPVWDVLKGTSSPEIAGLRIFGSLRSRTLRARYRKFKKVAQWMYITKNYFFPLGVADMLDFMESTKDGAGKCHSDGVAAALHFAERVGAVPNLDRISLSPLWLSALKSYQQEAQSIAPTSRKATIPSVAMIMAWELTLVATSSDFRWRIMSWIRLLKIWGCFRYDDVQGIDVSRLRLSEFGLSGVLSRTKTTGPGRKVVEVPFFIDVCCDLTRSGWMKAGWELWQATAGPFDRDYFLQEFDLSGGGFRRKMMGYEMCSAWNRRMLGELHSPVRIVGREWGFSDSLLLAPGGVSALWTEHSDRHFLPSASSQAGVPKPERDYLGRWGIMNQESDAYNLSARFIVASIQKKTVLYLFRGVPGLDETDLMESLSEFATKLGHDSVEILRAHKVMFGEPTLGGRNLHQDLLEPRVPPTDLVVPDACAIVGLSPKVANEPDAIPAPKDSPFWVSISRKSQFRRLHKRLGGCGQLQWAVTSSEDVQVISPGCADAYCRSCWPVKGPRASDPPSLDKVQFCDEAGDTASSSASSSSSESDKSA